MDDSYKNWGYEEFYTYLLIYAAMADSVIHENEKDLILHFTSNQKYKELLKIYESNNDAENIDILYYLKDKLGITKEHKEKIMKDINRVFYADGDYSSSEQITNFGIGLLFHN